MNADAFRHVYNYHFGYNRYIWENCIMPLSQAQFTQPVNYSLGSVRNQIVHLMDVDRNWFSDLRGVANPEALEPADSEDRAVIRQYGDMVEQNMRFYLANLHDDMLFSKPFPPGEDENVFLWQALLHVINHGTDHRAQLLRILHDLGVETPPQDYIFYVYDHP